MEDLIGEGYALTGLGIVQEKNGWLDDARIFYGKSLQKFKEVKDYEREDAVLSLMAGTYEAQSGLEEIMEEQAPAPEVYEEIEPSEDEVYTEKVTTMVENKRTELSSTSKYALTLIIYLLALLLAELLTTYINKTWGLTLDFIILFRLTGELFGGYLGEFLQLVTQYDGIAHHPNCRINLAHIANNTFILVPCNSCIPFFCCHCYNEESKAVPGEGGAVVG